MKHKELTINEWESGYQVRIPGRMYAYFFSFEGPYGQVVALSAAKKIIDEYFKLNAREYRKKNVPIGSENSSSGSPH